MRDVRRWRSTFSVFSAENLVMTFVVAEEKKTKFLVPVYLRGYQRRIFCNSNLAVGISGVNVICVLDNFTNL